MTEMSLFKMLSNFLLMITNLGNCSNYHLKDHCRIINFKIIFLLINFCLLRKRIPEITE